MAFKDNIGVSEELIVEMVDCSTNEMVDCSTNLEPLKIVAFVTRPIEITWINEDGAIVRLDVRMFEDK